MRPVAAFRFNNFANLVYKFLIVKMQNSAIMQLFRGNKQKKHLGGQNNGKEGVRMHNLYGNRRLNVLEIKGAFTLSNGMYCEWGESADEGLSVDIYDDKTKALLVGMEHGIYGTGGIKPSSRTLKPFIESFAHELEDSMVYYYGPRERSFELDELTKPVPKKTGRFAKARKKSRKR